MSDKDTYEYQEDQPNDGGSGEAYQAYVEDKPENKFAFLNNPKVISLVSAVIGLYLLGYVVSLIFGSGSETKAPSVVKPAVEQPAKLTESSKLSQLNEVVQKQQTMLNQINASNQQLNVAVNSIKSSLGDMQGGQNGVSESSFNSISDKLDEVKNEIADLRDRVTTIEKKVTDLEPKKPAKPLAQFYLRGIIEGRAWITDSKGINRTVRVGDNLVDYGRVTGIFPESGFVMTSSKRMIAFSKADS